MSFRTAFLSLCLFVGVRAQSIYGVSPFTVKTLTDATEDGSAAAILGVYDVNAELPNASWGASAWVQIAPGTADSAKLLQFKGFSGAVPVECFVTWTSTASPTFTFGATDHPVAKSTMARVENKWFHLAMASQAGTSSGVVTLRELTKTQYSVSWSETVLLKRESTLMAPANANPFTVSSK